MDNGFEESETELHYRTVRRSPSHQICSQSGSTFSGNNAVQGNLNQVGNIHTAYFRKPPARSTTPARTLVSDHNPLHIYQVTDGWSDQVSATDQRKAFFRWLPSIDFDQDHHIILRKRYKETGSWILQRKEFQQWYQSRSSQLLWCCGLRT